MTRSLSLLAAVTLLGGCLLPEEVDCTTLAAASVTLTVLDESGNPVPEATATFIVDDADPVACEAMPEEGSLVCGWEVEGHFEITVEAPGYQTQRVETHVASDECHVIGQALDVTLAVLNCTDIALPAVLVEVTDSQNALVTGGTVEWGYAEAGMDPEPCEVVGGSPNQWACAHEAWGDLEISITDAGPYEPFLEVVTVEHDGCHPITETLDAVLQYLPD